MNQFSLKHETLENADLSQINKKFSHLRKMNDSLNMYNPIFKLYNNSDIDTEKWQ